MALIHQYTWSCGTLPPQGSLLACNDLFAVLEDQKKWHGVTIFTSIDHTGQFKRKWRCPHLRTRKVISSQNFWGFLESFLRVSTVDDWHLAVADKSVYPHYKFNIINKFRFFWNKTKIPARWRAPFFQGSSEMMNIFTYPWDGTQLLKPPKEPFKRGFFPTNTNHTRCIWGWF